MGLKNKINCRATENGHIKIVGDMLKIGYRSIDAKNEHGQTAVHLACMKPNVCPKILSLLIENGANVNSRDIKGDTPLHVRIFQTFLQQNFQHFPNFSTLVKTMTPKRFNC